MGNKNNNYQENSQAIQAHLSITQSVIQRMASNSASSKTWCITVVSAILVIVADKERPQYALIALIPTLLFWGLDIYYLMLEKRFRNSYNTFIDKLHTRKVVASDLYAVSPSGSQIASFKESFFSFSIWPFYIALLIMIWVIQKIII